MKLDARTRLLASRDRALLTKIQKSAPLYWAAILPGNLANIIKQGMEE